MCSSSERERIEKELQQMDRWAENTEAATFTEFINDQEQIQCPFCNREAATLIASMMDSVKTILYYSCKLCGDFQVRRNKYGLHGEVLR